MTPHYLVHGISAGTVCGGQSDPSEMRALTQNLTCTGIVSVEWSSGHDRTQTRSSQPGTPSIMRMRAPVMSFRCFTMAPPLPMTLPALLPGTSTLMTVSGGPAAAFFISGASPTGPPCTHADMLVSMKTSKHSSNTLLWAILVQAPFAVGCNRPCLGTQEQATESLSRGRHLLTSEIQFRVEIRDQRSEVQSRAHWHAGLKQSLEAQQVVALWTSVLLLLLGSASGISCMTCEGNGMG